MAALPPEAAIKLISAFTTANDPKRTFVSPSILRFSNDGIRPKGEDDSDIARIFDEHLEDLGVEWLDEICPNTTKEAQAMAE